jgi:C4-dicarboxylate transporter, DctQ subunit
VRRWLQRLHAAEDLLLAALLLALVLLAGGQILARWLFDAGWMHGEPLSRVLVVWLTVLGALAATRERRHLAIDALPRILPPTLRRAADVLVQCFAAAICIVLAWYGASLVALEREAPSLLFGAMPSWWAMLVLPTGFALMALRFLLCAALGPPLPAAGKA